MGQNNSEKNRSFENDSIPVDTILLIKDGAVITFGHTHHEIENTVQGSSLGYDFIFSNTGNEPLLISNVRTSCHCTIASYPNEPKYYAVLAELCLNNNLNEKAEWAYQKIIELDPENPYVMALKVAIPKSYKKPLLMLIIEKKKVRHVLYDLDANKFPFGSYKVINFTKVHLLADLGGVKFTLKPNQDHFVRLNHGEKIKPVQLRVAIKGKKRSKLIYSSMLMNRKSKRMLMFFYATKDEADRPTIKCRSLVDFFIKNKKPS